MKYFIWIWCATNLYIGLRFFLNAIQVLQTSKYSQTATIVFAVLFLLMGASGLGIYFFKQNNTMALVVCVGPWILAFFFLLFNMLTGNYQ